MTVFRNPLTPHSQTTLELGLDKHVYLRIKRPLTRSIVAFCGRQTLHHGLKTPMIDT
jgi:hypothetical protein